MPDNFSAPKIPVKRKLTLLNFRRSPIPSWLEIVYPKLDIANFIIFVFMRCVMFFKLGKQFLIFIKAVDPNIGDFETFTVSNRKGKIYVCR